MQQETAGEVVVLGALEGAEHDRPGNVAAFGSNAEDVVVGKERWEEIHRLRLAGVSVSQLARSSGLDRKTVRRALRADGVAALPAGAGAGGAAQRAPSVARRARRAGRLLGADSVPGTAPGARLCGRAIRPCAMRCARCAWRPRPARSPSAGSRPGRASRRRPIGVEARVRFGGEPAEVHIFVLTLGYSRRGWAEGYEHERMESLLAAHEHGFEHFGGVTREILYDRMRTVLQGERDGAKRWNPTFQAFAQHWGFEPRVCRPYRAQTKGKVESGVKYVKRNFLPGRMFRDLEDFNAQLAAWQAEIADLRIHGTTHEPPIERFAARRRHSRPWRAVRASCGGPFAVGWWPTIGWWHRHQPLLGAVAADRGDGGGGALGRTVADPPPREPGGRAPGAHRPATS